MRLPKRLLAVSLVVVGVASARGQNLAEYEIASSDGAKGTLTVSADGTVVRRMTYPDSTVHTCFGKGQYSGATLAVRFDGTGEPRDLTGEWQLKGESESGAYHGSVTFGLRHGKWSTRFRGTFDDEDGQIGPIEIRGRFQGLVLVAERLEGDAVVASASYVLAADGLALATSGSRGRETFTRAKLPQTGGPSATYTFEDGGRVVGALSTGAEDKGTKVQTQSASKGPRVEGDPVPSSLRAVRATKIYRTADANGAVLQTVRANEMVPVCGREKGFWIVGPFADANQRGRGTRGYLPEADLDNRLRYADVPAPIFLADKPPSAASVVQKDLGTCYLDAALMAIATVQSSAIYEMIKDNEDGTVSVRFFRRADDGYYDEHWVRINRTIVVDERGRSHYTVGEGGQLWPALVEKAFAAWRGRGWYRNIEGGVTSDVFEVVLGMQARSRAWNVPLPFELGGRGGGGRRGGRGRDLPTLGADDQKVLATYRELDSIKKEAATLQERPALRRDIAYVDSHLDTLEKTGLSKEGAKTLHDYYAARLDGPLGSGRYGSQAKETYDLIKTTLDAHLPVAMSTRVWGAETAGSPSGRENMELVPGLASQHEYMVLGVYEDENHLKWVKVVNPWHRFTRRYERRGDKLVASASRGRQEGEPGAFAVELSDVMRYFGTVAFVPK
jgi:hypothetical protein